MGIKKWVYLFDEVREVEKAVSGNWDDVKSLVGGKGAALLDMTRAQVPVPPFFTVTTKACNEYQKTGKFPAGIWTQELSALKKIEQKTGKKFGDSNNPLLVSCRSGAKFSMPGMMDTVLNIGLTDETAVGMAKLTGNPRFVYDSYRRLVEMFGTVVLSIPDEAFETPLNEYKSKKGFKLDVEMTADDWKEMVQEFSSVVKREKGFDFPQDPFKQLELTMEATFKSWNGKRAVDYRRHANIPDDLGTAVNIVTMVFGNMGGESGTGVAYTRDPSTGNPNMMGEYLLNAQGEDVVAGTRNTNPIEHLRTQMPEAYLKLVDITAKLEDHYREMQDFEFTIERGIVWVLQTRTGKRTAKAAVKIAVDMANAGLISKEEAISRVTPESVSSELAPQLSISNRVDFNGLDNLLAIGTGASPGISSGRVYFDAHLAEQAALESHAGVILLQRSCQAEDIHGILACTGIITTEGGSPSLAAHVAQEFNIPCVVDAIGLKIDKQQRSATVGDSVIRQGQVIAIDGSTGRIYFGEIDLRLPSPQSKSLDRISLVPGTVEANEPLRTLLSWADIICGSIQKSTSRRPGRHFEVWANADYPKDARRARAYGAMGIGLCRTEHMFFEPERLPIVQRMILSETSEQRTEALNELLPFLRKDFDGLFEAMDGYPVIIRLIDPPLQEFMPSEEGLLEEVITLRVKGETTWLDDKEKLLNAVKGMHESNPILGLRGVRLSIAMPEIAEMQVRAVFEAAANCTKRGIVVQPGVMIPMISTGKELDWIQPRLERVASAVLKAQAVKFDYKFGVMIETPRAALTAKEIAKNAQFFSFGSNDLTQMTFGYSRDDAERNFLATYVEQGILPKNPFQTLDRDGVGRLMKIAVEDGRTTRPNLEIGICGEQGGDPESIEWCYLIGNNYVSCSPFRVPIARLAAAHAVLKYRNTQ